MTISTKMIIISICIWSVKNKMYSNFILMNIQEYNTEIAAVFTVP